MNKIWKGAGLAGLVVLLAACGPSETELALEARTQELSEAREQISRLQATQQGLQGDLDTTRSQLADARHNLGQLRSEQDALQTELAETQGQLASTHQELMTTTAARDTARAQASELEGVVANLRGELTSLHGELAQREQQLQDYVAAAAAVQSDSGLAGYQKAGQELQAMSQQLEQLRNSLLSVQQQVQ